MKRNDVSDAIDRQQKNGSGRIERASKLIFKYTTLTNMLTLEQLDDITFPPVCTFFSPDSPLHLFVT